MTFRSDVEIDGGHVYTMCVDLEGLPSVESTAADNYNYFHRTLKRSLGVNETDDVTLGQLLSAVCTDWGLDNHAKEFRGVCKVMYPQVYWFRFLPHLLARVGNKMRDASLLKSLYQCTNKFSDAKAAYLPTTFVSLGMLSSWFICPL